MFDTLNMAQRMHRDWDMYRAETDRYWYNIPAVYVVNSLLYPDFRMELYVSEGIKQHPLFSLLLKLNKRDNFSLYVSKQKYRNTEPTMWRMIPLWKDDCDILLCRDIDSLPTKDEYKATISFIESDFLIHTMRSHRQHNSPATRMLAGLCGFKKGILPHISVSSFAEYYRRSTAGWGCDQNTLIDIFYNKIKDKKTVFLDSALKTETHDVVRNTETGYIDSGSTEYTHEVLDYIDKYTTWAGEPIDFRKEKLKSLLNFDYEPCRYMSEILEDEKLREFYVY